MTQRITLESFLMQARYPVEKSELLGEAEGAVDSEDYGRLETLPEREYDTAADVRFALETEGATTQKREGGRAD